MRRRKIKGADNEGTVEQSAGQRESGGSRGDCETVYGMKPLIWSVYKSSSYSGGLSFICIGIEMTAGINMLITKTTPVEIMISRRGDYSYQDEALIHVMNSSSVIVWFLTSSIRCLASIRHFSNSSDESVPRRFLACCRR